MPNGIHHDNVHKAGWAVIGPSSLFAILINPYIGFGMIAGYALGRYLNPDADLVGISYAEGMALRHFSVLGWVWVGYWTPYGAAFKRLHRSVWTHFPFLSTIIRYIYLLWWLPLVDIKWTGEFMAFIISMWFATSLSDMGHYVSDKWEKFFSKISGTSNQSISKSSNNQRDNRKNTGRKRKNNNERRMGNRTSYHRS